MLLTPPDSTALPRTRREHTARRGPVPSHRHGRGLDSALRHGDEASPAAAWHWRVPVQGHTPPFGGDTPAGAGCPSCLAADGKGAGAISIKPSWPPSPQGCWKSQHQIIILFRSKPRACLEQTPAQPALAVPAHHQSSAAVTAPSWLQEMPGPKTPQLQARQPRSPCLQVPCNTPEPRALRLSAHVCTARKERPNQQLLHQPRARHRAAHMPWALGTEPTASQHTKTTESSVPDPGTPQPG